MEGIDTFYDLFFSKFIPYFVSYTTFIIGGTLASVLLYAFINFKKKFNVLDFDNQSSIICHEENRRISCLQPEGNFMTFMYVDAQTLYECLLRGEKQSNNGCCLGWRENTTYNWLKYSDVIKKAQDFGYGLLLKGLQRGSHVGIYSVNCVEYAIAEHACYSQSMVIVPIYDTLGLHICQLIINEAELKIVICDNESKMLKLLDESLYTPSLQTIIVISAISNEAYDRAQSYNVDVVMFSEVEREGKSCSRSCTLSPPSPHDLAVICYTGGTTGNPKGVMLTHGNIIANVSSVMQQAGDESIRKDDTHLSYLPMAHMFERCCQVGLLMVGGKIGFFKGEIRKLNEDFSALQPTIFPSVPRVLNNIHDTVLKKARSNIFKKFIFDFTLARKKRQIQKTVNKETGWLEWLIFRKIRHSFGGRVRIIIVGSAPTAEPVMSLIKCVLNCIIVEGYGQTECVGPCTLTFPKDTQLGHVGPPLPCCSIKLVDVPDLDYFTKKGAGEICVKGTTVCVGYLKDPEKTKAIIDEDGWLHTGDIGIWLANGTLKVIDRKSHVFKIAHGEFIVPEKIENIYLMCPSVSQVFVYGESMKSSIVAVVIPDHDFVSRWCSEQHVEYDKAITEHVGLKYQILNDMVTEGKKAGLKPFEQVKNIYLTANAFTIENNLLTPTMKIKRKECFKHFATEINLIYTEFF